MDELVLNLIKEAGWIKGRKIDIQHYLEILTKEEYDVFQEAKDFLEEYGELKIKFDTPATSGNYFTLNIDPTIPATSIFREVSKRYERHCNEKLVVIGQIDRMDMIWYISPSGTFYGGNDDFLICLGKSFTQAFYHVVSGAQLEAVLVEE